MDAQILLSLIKEEYRNYKSYKPGELIFSENDKCDSISIIISGSIKTESFSLSNQNVITVLKRNEIFGNTLIFSSMPFYQGDITAIEQTQIVDISKFNLLSAFANTKVTEEFLRVLSDDRLNDKINLKLISLTSIEERFFYYLSNNDDVIEFKSITNLASSLHVSREALSRLLSKLIKENQIKKINHFIKKV